MDHSYLERRTKSRPGKGPAQAAQAPSLEALRTGAAAPTREQMGRRVDLPDAMREKMETAFGADLSAVRLYESETVGEAGANAVTRGSDIAFAPGLLDFTSFGGQSLLGHELSHVVSQARGEVAGGGFLNDAALEARADREGAMAAAGQQIAAAPLSAVSAASAAGPMQADKETNKINKHRDVQADQIAAMSRIRREGGDFLSNKEYIRANRKLADAQKWESYWTRKQEQKTQDSGKAPEETASVGLRVLDRLRGQNTETGEDGTSSFDDIGYLKEAESAMKIMREGNDLTLSDRDMEDIAAHRSLYDSFAGDIGDLLTDRYRDKLIAENKARLGRSAPGRRSIEVDEGMLDRLQREGGEFISGYQNTQLAGYDKIAEQGGDRNTMFDMARARTRENQMRTILKRHDLRTPLSTPTKLMDSLKERYTGEEGELDEDSFDRRVASAFDATPDVLSADPDVAYTLRASLARSNRRGLWQPKP